MQIAPDILARHLHDAAAEQLTAEYQSKGYVVEAEAALNGLRADLVARRGDEVIVFEIKAGRWSEGTVQQVSHLRDYVANEIGGHFRLVLVGLPEPVEIEIEKVRQILEDYAGTVVDDQLAGEASHFHTLDVEDVEYETLRWRDDSLEVKGSAVLSLVLQYGSDGDVARDDGLEVGASYPLRFHISLVFVEGHLEPGEVYQFEILRDDMDGDA